MPRALTISALSRLLLVGWTLLVSAASFCLAGDQGAAAGAGRPVIVLDGVGSWRLYHVLKPPVLRTEEGLKPILAEEGWLNRESPEPPGDWHRPDFDDGSWLRGPAHLASRTPYLARLCLRGKFTVTDPATIRGLSVSVGYHGGVIVYVNGQELARGHLAPVAPGPAAMAEDYPQEAVLAPDGAPLDWPAQAKEKPAGEVARRLALRDRTLADVAVPAAMLRKGVNVIAIEVVRTPYPKCVEAKDVKIPYDIRWHTCEILRAQVTAADSGGLVPNAARPAGFQVWNNDLLTGDFDVDFGDPAEPLRPIALVGARNGAFSGKVVLGSTQPIRDIEVSASDFKADGATIPASCARIRYAVPWGREEQSRSPERASPYPGRPTLLGSLVESPPAEVPVAQQARGPAPAEPAPVWGAVVPVWLTVKVPADAKPGLYEGSLVISAADVPPVTVPVHLRVADWSLPDPQDYVTCVELMQSPDTLALEYEVEPWGDRHFELIAKSMEFLKDVGSGVLYVPLICYANYGNEQSMVRWTPKGDGRYGYDFSVMDRYLETAERHMGKPKVVIFLVWDVLLLPKYEGHEGKVPRAVAYANRAKDRVAAPSVTVVDPATGRAENAYLPPYADPSSKALWKPLFAELRERMRTRGLEKAMLLGIISDGRPSTEELEFFREVASGLPWASHAHYATPGGFANIGYQACVFTVKFPGDPDQGRLYGWKRPELIVQAPRTRLDTYPHTVWRHLGEINIAGNQRGVGRLGADFWHAVRDARGQRKGRVFDRYPQSYWGNLNLTTSLLAPGPQGPVATTHHEVFREGIQECEARIFIERALTDDALRAKLGGDLARRCQDALDERVLFVQKGVSNLQLTGYWWNYAPNWWWTPGVAGHNWFVASLWQERSAKLYALAAEVGGKLAQGRR